MSKEITPEMVKDATHYSNWQQYKLVYRKEIAQIEREARIKILNNVLVLANQYACEDKTMKGSEEIRGYHYFNAIKSLIKELEKE